MAFASVRGLEALDEDCLHVMIQAYVDAWSVLQGSIFGAYPRAHDTRQRLERRIVELIRSGERDPGRLRDAALSRFSLSV
jgi:hypothetical protein